MRLGGKSRYLVEVNSKEDIADAVNWAKSNKLPFRMIGDGSNIVWRDEGFPGLILVNRIKAREILSQEKSEALIKLEGGEQWDLSVEWTIQQGYSGLEYLSLIPGTVGAAPVQNIGAYGAELANVLKEVGVYDATTDSFNTIPSQECDFSYRNSRFKSRDNGRFMITHIVVRLNKDVPHPPFYEALQKYFDENSIKQFTPAVIREAVIAIRSSKLPDWRVVANNGSFFTNPLIDQTHFQELQAQYPDIKGWPSKDGRVKVAAGWLVEQAGFKGMHDDETGMATWEKQALVLVNESARTTADLLAFRQKIIFKVDELFGIVLQQEPELLP